MMRRIITIFSLIAVLALIAPIGAKGQSACCKDGSDCGAGEVCKPHDELGWGGCGTDSDKPNYCVLADDPVPGPGPVISSDIGPKDYFKIRRGFKLELKDPSGTGPASPVAFEKGAIVYSKKVGVITSCYSHSDGRVTAGQECWASEAGIIALLNIIYSITDWIFYLLTLFVVIMIIFGGFNIITAAGDPAKASKGKGILTYAAVGLAVALLAKLIPSLVSFIMGM